MQQALIAKELPPREHFVDAASIRAELLVHSRAEQGITLRGPTRPSQGWQQQVAGAYTFEQFTVAWERPQVCGPQGKRSGRWHVPSADDLRRRCRRTLAPGVALYPEQQLLDAAIAL